jgi:Rrf2 family cysteine metabolism transcriptional repressor
MKISSRFRYGLRLLVDLAANYEKGPILLKNIAECERISKKYLEQIVIALRTAGILGATRGSKGGYYLTKPPEKIRLVDIYRLLEGPFAPVECIDNPKGCTLVKTCPTKQLWSNLAKSIEGTFKDITLADLLKK